MHSQTAAAAWPAYCRPAGGVRIVDATLIAAPSSTKNADHARAPEMHQTRKGNQMPGIGLATLVVAALV